MPSAGPLALVGGSEWTLGCEFDSKLLEASGGSEVFVIPAAAAFEHPERSVERATDWFSALGAKVIGLPVTKRSDAEDAEIAETVRNARFLYLSDGSTQHLRSVLKESLLWGAIRDAWHSGAVVAGSAAGATVLGDPMVDPRGGTFAVGLGLIRHFAVVPHWEKWTDIRASRMSHLVPTATAVAEVEERTALIRWADGTWETAGSGKVNVNIDHQPIDLDKIEATVEI